MKLFLIAAALVLAPATATTAAYAQVAAGAVPNTFDRPAAAAAAAPAQAAPAVPSVTTPANPQSEETIRAFIAGAQAGTIDYALMTDDLAGKVREQEAAILPLFQQFGALQAVDFVGSRETADLFAVVFANAATQWIIGFDESGKVAALFFRPAE